MPHVKRLIAMTAVFALLAPVLAAGQAPRPPRQRRNPEAMAKLAKTADTLIAKYVAKQLQLAPEKAEKFINAYVDAQAAMRKRFIEARRSGNRNQIRTIFRETRDKLKNLVTETLGPDQAKKAQKILSSLRGVGMSVQILLEAKVEEAKVEKALPVLVKYEKAQGELFKKVRSGKIQRDQIRAERDKLREATAGELAPIVGEQAAQTWKARTGRMGRRAQPGQRRQPGQRGQRRGGGAPKGPMAP